MAIGIQTNFASMIAQNAMGRSTSSLNVSMERLGTGLRINNAKDDAAGLTIANRMSSDVRAYNAGIGNINKTQDMLQTADQSVAELSSITDRMTELATQSANGTNSTADRTAMNAEYTQLGAEAKRIMSDTKFAGNKLFGSEGLKKDGIQVVIGQGSTDTVKMSLASSVGSLVATVSSMGSIGTAVGAASALGKLKAASASISATRSKVGAYVNSLEHTKNNIENVVLNTEVAKGRIMDADFAKEGANMSKQMLLQQSGAQVLANSKSMQGLALNMIG
ncbi:MAG: flagellin [Aeromonas sobria]